MSPELPRRAVEDQLRDEMLAAQQRYFKANEEYIRLRQLCFELCPTDPDLVCARDRAARIRKATFDEYARTLRRYSDMVVRSEVPEDLRRVS